jgi:hypothetical protein
MSEMVILNFSHPLTGEQVSAIEQQLGRSVERILPLPAQFDQQQPFVPQMEQLLSGVELSPEEWQSAPLLVVLPSFNAIAAVVLAELHGRMGYFPPIVRLRPVEGALPPRYDVAEVINLQNVRDAARLKRL